jgi:transporter family protein
MNYILYFYLLIIVISYTLNPYFKKNICKNIPNFTYILMNHIAISILLVLYLSYLLMNNKLNIGSIETLSYKQYLLLLGGAITSILGTLMLINLVRMDDVSYIIPHIQSFVILTVLVFGVLFFKEKITLNKLLGVLMITLGLYFINKKQ